MKAYVKENNKEFQKATYNQKYKVRLWDPDTHDSSTETLGHWTLAPRTLAIGP